MLYPVVSIVTATYNSAKYIQATFDSIRRQSFTQWEWLVTDDASLDETWDLLKTFASIDGRVKILRLHENVGAGAARNKSIEQARGKYLAFIDSDDRWQLEKLEKQLLFMSDEVEFSFTGYRIIDEMGRDLGKSVDTSQEGQFFYEDILRKKATIGCSTVMLNRESIVEVVMPLMRSGQDYALWLSLLKGGRPAYLLPDPLTEYRITPKSVSRNKLKKAIRQWEIYRKQECLDLPKTIVCFSLYVYRALIRTP